MSTMRLTVFFLIALSATVVVTAKEDSVDPAVESKDNAIVIPNVVGVTREEDEVDDSPKSNPGKDDGSTVKKHEFEIPSELKLKNKVVSNPSTNFIRLHAYYSELRERLRYILDEDENLEKALAKSLKHSVRSAVDQMSPRFYKAINKEFDGNGFPDTIDKWAFDDDCFLWKYGTWIPNESGSEWEHEDGYNHKLIDIVCHFHWLICDILNFSVHSTQFGRWLDTYMNFIGMFLDTKESFNDETLETFKRSPLFHLDNFIKNKNNWQTYNQFFYRRFNDANVFGFSPLSPIDEPMDNWVITSPAACTFKHAFPIEKNGNIKAIKVKSQLIANVDDLLKLSLYHQDFYGGTFVHYYLSCYDYHRYHVPVTGKAIQVLNIPGFAYLNVTLKDGVYDAPDDATDGFEFKQARGVIIIDTKYYLNENGVEVTDEGGLNDIGLVAVIPVGMLPVSSVGMNVGLEGQIVKKGQEFGRFKYGGSDIIMLFQKPMKGLKFEKMNDRNKHFDMGNRAITILKESMI